MRSPLKNVTLDSVADIIAGQSPSSSTYNSDGIGVPFFQGKADFGKLYPNVRYWCSEPKKMAIKNDILISVRAPVGPTNLCDIEACIGRGLSAIRPKKELNVKFLLHFLRYIEPKLSGMGVGSTFSAITQSDLKNLKIPLPPLPIQKKIAEVLDKADELRQIKKKTIEKLDELIKSIFLDMFGDPVTNPKGWEVKKLGDVCSKITDGTHVTPTYLSEGVDFISAKNIKKGKINWSDLKYISQQQHTDFIRRCNPEKGDVLITKSGSLGMAALIDTDRKFSLFESLALVKYNRSSINGQFLQTLLNTNAIKHQYAKIIKGVGVKHLHLIDIRSILVICPTMATQEEFKEKVYKISQIRQNHEDSSHRIDNLFNSLMQRAFKGELQFKD